MGNIFGRAEIEELKEELMRTEQALQKHLEAAAHELDAEVRRRKAAEADAAAAAATSAKLEDDVAGARADEAAALQAAADARRAHDEHALLVKRVLTAQRKYGVELAWPGVPTAADASAEAAALARSPSERALLRAGAGARAGGNMTADMDLDARPLAALLWPRELGDFTVSARDGRTLATAGVLLPGLSAGLAGALDTARLGLGVIHTFPILGLACGASALYDPVLKTIDDGALAVLLVGGGGGGRGSGRCALGFGPRSGGAVLDGAGAAAVALGHARAVLDASGDLELGSRWLLCGGANVSVDAMAAVNLNSQSYGRERARKRASAKGCGRQRHEHTHKGRTPHTRTTAHNSARAHSARAHVHNESETEAASGRLTA
jgi:hypothetical protein